MLSVKSVFSSGTGGGDNSLWAERYDPAQTSSKENPYVGASHIDGLIELHVNYNSTTGQVIPELSLTTEGYSTENPFVKVAVGYNVVNI